LTTIPEAVISGARGTIWFFLPDLSDEEEMKKTGTEWLLFPGDWGCPGQHKFAGNGPYGPTMKDYYSNPDADISMSKDNILGWNSEVEDKFVKYGWSLRFLGK